MILNAGLPERNYEGISSWKKLVDALEQQMSAYNLSFTQA
jgi:dynein heavy chain